jgi:O-acetyl-ADP-ribose deacetylase (regulator of RNase III)
VNTRLVIGDITTAEADAIVNAANERMLGGGGVDGAIHRAAGPALLDACRAVPAVGGIRCPTGEARITVAGNLRARHVIHTVGPVYAASTEPHTLLAAAYRNSFTLAVQHGCRTLACPAISCGVFGYPLQEAAEIALGTCQGADFAGLDITFYLFDASVYAVWDTVRRSLP